MHPGGSRRKGGATRDDFNAFSGGFNRAFKRNIDSDDFMTLDEFRRPTVFKSKRKLNEKDSLQVPILIRAR